MNKNLFFAIVLGIVITSLYIIIIKRGNTTEIENKSDKMSNIPALEPDVKKATITADNQLKYEYKFFEIKDFSNIRLFSNLTDKLSSTEFKEKYNCVNLVNGGFFSENDKHIGLFVSDGEELSPSAVNSLFNGFLIYDGNIVEITEKHPKITPKFGLQTGPLLIYDAQNVSLKLKSDNNARRILAITTNVNTLIFMTIYSESNVYDGPKLSEVAGIIKEAADQNGFKIQSVINLDGGYHSAYLDSKVSLKEVSTPGSFFCVK